jgi:hypothetical protein
MTYSTPPPQPAPPSPAYPEPPRYAVPSGPPLPLAALILPVGFALVVLGGVLRGISGFMDPGGASRSVYASGNLFVTIGLLGTAWSLLQSALRERTDPPALRVILVIASVAVLGLALIVSYNAGAAMILPL